VVLKSANLCNPLSIKSNVIRYAKAGEQVAVIECGGQDDLVNLK